MIEDFYFINHNGKEYKIYCRNLYLEFYVNINGEEEIYRVNENIETRQIPLAELEKCFTEQYEHDLIGVYIE